eukprot:6491104-Amphidinium_carterae.2
MCALSFRHLVAQVWCGMVKNTSFCPYSHLLHVVQITVASVIALAGAIDFAVRLGLIALLGAIDFAVRLRKGIARLLLAG